jgi:hypothetical protein
LVIKPLILIGISPKILDSDANIRISGPENPDPKQCLRKFGCCFSFNLMSTNDAMMMTGSDKAEAQDSGGHHHGQGARQRRLHRARR